MALDRLFAESKLTGDIAVAASINDAAQYFHLAARQPIGFLLRRGLLMHQMMKGGNEAIDRFLSQPVAAAGNTGDGRLQIFVKPVVENDSARPDLQCLHNMLCPDRPVEQQYLDLWPTAHDRPHRFEPWQPRH